MKGNSEVVGRLNEALTLQLGAINQLFLHARMCKNWGLGALNGQIYKMSISAMKQADGLIERILFLEGLPNLQDMGRLAIGEDVPEVLGNDLNIYGDIRSQLQRAITFCETDGDYLSRDLLDDLLGKTEDYIDWLETQQSLIGNTGLENYMQSMMN
ncbi:MAG: bacterioferritin [Cyanobacteria bacterium P01_C01_bin.89]